MNSSSVDRLGQMLSHEELQAAELVILDAFQEFCSRYELSFTPIGGTMLGAVRHQGFIPWDDDIDIGMPRPSFEDLLSLRDRLWDETGLLLMGYASASIFESPFCKIVDPTIVVQTERERVQSNLWIDVMPIDSLPSDDAQLRRLYRRAWFHQHCLMLCTSTVESSSTWPKKVVKALATPLRKSKFFLRLHSRRLNSLGKRIPFGSTPYAGILTWGMYGPGERFSLSGLEDMATCSFEGRTLPCMTCWDEYLSGIYGDYMIMPPEEKRVSHGMEAWRVAR